MENIVWKKTSVFQNGSSQAVHIPAEFCFDCKEVFIRRDDETGDLILSANPGDWDSFFDLVDQIDLPQDFLAERNNSIGDDKKLF